MQFVHSSIFPLLLVFLFFSCKKEDEKVIIIPTVRTELVQEAELFSVTAGGNVSDDGGDNATERGICFSLRPVPDLSDSVFKDTLKGKGAYAIKIGGLEKGKSYYFRAWAKNSAGLVFGNVLNYSTADIPVLSTADPQEVTGATVMAGGNISGDGGKPVLEAGICYDTLPDPDVSDSLKKVSAPSVGAFSIKLIDLNPSTTYYYRAYARNAAGVAYGETKSFTTTVLYTPGDSLTDQQGIKYPTIEILGKRWMAENLRSSVYRDGSQITNAKTAAEWSSQTGGAWCNYDNQAPNNKIYGKLYNWLAVKGTKELCPTGWKVPSDADWDNLIAYLGDVNKAGLKMRTSGTSLWNAPNQGATNSSGFSGVPGGNRGDFGAFGFKGSAAYFWTSTQAPNQDRAKFRALEGNLSTVSARDDYKKIGMSVRCVEE